ncbi:hypothetical protein GCM10010313_45860 [Streptomyces violarus]|uniref:Dihydrofolate reductase n=1 Tax=Streptomyces violarus TaxID=67380 RepID=A0A7W4ZRE6_9ACTN|nr:dihydrofolate reductase [Streptomyces violarus]GHD16994.1 hypothetical protein GCM10010313_45860 [Streptomyces violarus]
MLIPGDRAVARIRELHEAEGGDLAMMGSPALVRTLLSEGLADELQLIVMPVILGGGRTIFPGTGRSARWRCSPRPPPRPAPRCACTGRRP